MSPTFQKLIAPIFLLSSLATGISFLNHNGIIFNATPSMPMGFYKIDRVKGHLLHLHDNQIILLCPPSPADNPAMKQAISDHWLIRSPKSHCIDHVVPFLKKIAAQSGQSVQVSMTGLAVDNHMLPRTAIEPRAKNGTRIIHEKIGLYSVMKGQIWVYDNSSPWAYDSRYWGPISKLNVIAKARPVLTW